MSHKKIIIFAISAASFVLPAIASAQQYERPYDRSYQQPSYAQPPGDYGRGSGRYGFAGYPQFRGIEAHIRQEIQENVRNDMIAPDDARDLMGQLRQIQMQEAREFRVHHWNLPNDDSERIREQLGRLDQLVDQIRDEQ
jgi:hypothetical protein